MFNLFPVVVKAKVWSTPSLTVESIETNQFFLKNSSKSLLIIISLNNVEANPNFPSVNLSIPISALIANNIHEKTKVLALGFSEKFKIYSNKFFDTILIHTNNQANRYYFKALNESINVRFLNDDLIGISLDETTSIKDVVKLWSIFDLNIKYEKTLDKLISNNKLGIINFNKRQSSFLNHPIFHKYRS